MDVATAINLASSLLAQAIKISTMINRAQAEGRDSLTDAELDELGLENDRARASLQAAIERARAAGQ